MQWHELTDQIADATFSHPKGGSLRITWTFEQAQRAHLAGKDNWKNYPRAMLRARCIAEGVRAVYPAAIGGMMVVEEAQDTTADRDAPTEPKHMGPAEVVPPAAPPKFYDATKFDHNLPKWAETIQQGRKSAKDYIDFAATRGEPFTEEQKARLLSVKAVPPADEVQDVQPKTEAAPAVTYAGLAGRLQNAANLDELDEIATLIGAVENPQHRQELTAIYEDTQASFA